MVRDSKDKGRSFMKTKGINIILASDCVAAKRARDCSLVIVGLGRDGGNAYHGTLSAVLSEARNDFRFAKRQRRVNTTCQQGVY